MYFYKGDYQKLLDIVDKKFTKQNGQRDWKNAVSYLNSVFNEASTIEAWRKRYLRYVNAKLKRPEPAVTHQLSFLDDSKIKSFVISKLVIAPASLKELISLTKANYYEILGIIKSIQQQGIYKILEEQVNDDIIFRLEKVPVAEKQTYQHTIGDTRTFTFIVMSDSHLGSVNEQLSFINYIYDYAVERNIKTIYHCGDLTEGVKRSRPEHLYSLHAISFDEQVEHVVKNYPKREGVTTYFITGNHDHFHIQNGGANVGKAVSAQRSDMIYLGINTAVINFGKTKMELFHPQDGSSYALSYGGQKYLDSLTGGDKPNIIFVGHHHKSMYFIYRNVHYFEVPSTHLQSDWEKGKRIMNISGFWVVTLEIDESGTITRIMPESILQYRHIKEDWKQYK